MANIGSVVVQFLADDKMSKTVGKITSGLKDFNTKADGSDKKAGRLSGTLKAGLAGGAAAAGAAFVALGGFMLDTAKAAIEDDKEADRLADTLSSLKGVTDDVIAANADWIDSMELATGVADSELREAMSKLALATGDVEQAQKLVTIAVDAAAGSGKDLTTVTDAMAKAATGNTDALKRQFPWLDKNKDGAISLKEATDGLTKAYGGAAAAASNKDPWEKLKIVWGQLKESLGQWVLPLIDKFGKWFKDPKNQKAIQTIIDKVGTLASDMGQKLVPMIEKFLEWIGSEEGKKSMHEWADTLGSIANAVKSLVGAFQRLSAAWNRIPEPLRKLIAAGFGIGNGNLFNGYGAGSAAAAAAAPATMASGPTVAGPPIFVTEDMVAQAISGLLLRSQGRRGRLVPVA